MREAEHRPIVYGSMDRPTLDAAYNNSAAVADSDRYIADWLRRSEALRARRPDRLNLVFGDGPRAQLDFFVSERPGDPTLLFFHGGYWQRNTKEGFSFVAEGPLAHGFHVAVAGYTLAPDAAMDDIVVRRAPRCIGCIGIWRHWAEIPRGSISAAGPRAAILPRC